MKKIILFFIFLFISLTGCKKSGNISFCEGVTKDGEAVKCGTSFTTGDLSAVINIDEPFETERLAVSVVEIRKFKNVQVQSFKVKVDPDKKSAVINLPFYSEGQYLIKITGKEKKLIAEGKIKIIDTY